ncbi:MAG TPA: hypothetical protein VF595_05020 [Tepidisphaeraceae bacterium]
MLSSLLNWLNKPVIQDSGVDRPFRLRLLSVVMMASGWAIFLVSCLIGLWLARYNTPILNWAELVQCRGLTNSIHPYLQLLRGATEAVGAVLFIGGMLSVALFDRRDRIPVWKMD